MRLKCVELYYVLLFAIRHKHVSNRQKKFAETIIFKLICFILFPQIKRILNLLKIIFEDLKVGKKF